MSVLIDLISLIFRDFSTFSICTLIGALTFYVTKFYVKVFTLPKGPLPLPFVGNILMFRGRKQNNFLSISELHKSYGPIFTFWAGNNPMVFINDLAIAKEAFRRNEFSNRMMNFFTRVMSGPNNDRCDIAGDNFGPRWETSRRIAHAAVRKYAVTQKLADLVADVTEDTVKLIFKEQKVGQPFDIQKYTYYIFHNILASSAFGKRYPMNDPELVALQRNLKAFDDSLLFTLDFVPFLKPFFKKRIQIFLDSFDEVMNFVKNNFTSHFKSFDENNIRDFSDALIFAKNEALAEGKESAPYLTDDNLTLSILDLFTAGSDTSQYTTRWIFNFMANYPEMQKRMREEISTVIGDRMPVQEDRSNLNFVNAFICEVMRQRPIAPFGLPHETMIDAKLENYIIPKKTPVLVNLYSIQHQEKYFPDPYAFKPQRFLASSGHFLAQQPALIPFGIGRRACLGEKLAIADVFLVLVRFLQLTSGYQIALPNGPGSGDSGDLEPFPDLDGFNRPKDFDIILVKDKND